MDERPLSSKRGRNPGIRLRWSFLHYAIDRAKKCLFWFGLVEAESIEMEYRWLSRIWRDSGRE